jgi:uncharacterized protein YecT (DUF1311 family)
MRRLIRLLLTAAMVGAPAQAQNLWANEAIVRDCFAFAGIAETQPNCLGYAASQCQTLPGGSTTPGIADCISAETSIWDKILNEQYQATRAQFRSIGTDLSQSLLDAQRAWITYRDAECALTYERWIGGSIRSVAHANCVLGFTSERAIELRDMRGGQ